MPNTTILMKGPVNPLIPGSLRFYGDVDGDDGRVKTDVDGASLAANIGGGDFTIEGWIWALTTNDNSAITAGANSNWTLGNIFFDRDIFGSDDPGFGISLGAGIMAFGLNVDSSNAQTIVGTTDIRGDTSAAWAHFSVQRRSSDGEMALHVDGSLESSTTGPTGTLKYPAGRAFADLCGPNPPGNASCSFSDPYMVLGTEKHDVGLGFGFLGFYGYLSCLRLSTSLRYSMSAGYTAPTSPLGADADTAILYLMDDQAGTQLSDRSGNNEHGTLSLNGSSQPTWETASPF